MGLVAGQRLSEELAKQQELLAESKSQGLEIFCSIFLALWYDLNLLM